MAPSVYVGADVAVGIAFLLGGWFVWRSARAPLPAALLAMAGGSWFFGNFGGWPGVAGVAAASATYLHRGPLIHLDLTLPSCRPRSRIMLAAVLLGYAVSTVAVLARSDVVTVGVAVGLVAVTGLRGRLSVDAVPVAALAAALAGPALARLVLPVSASGGALLWYDGCLLVLAVALTARLLRARRADIADLLVGLSVAPSQSLRDALAKAVGDPTLQVGFVAGDGFVDARGERIEPSAKEGRTVTSLTRDGRLFGFISHDSAVLADPVLVEAVATAAALTSANARLQADVERQADLVRGSRRRIVTAGVEERRRLEGELSQGPSARLTRVAALLDAVPSSGTQEGLVEEARIQVGHVVSDLTDLARGLHPMALRSSGLRGALADLAAAAPTLVSVEVAGVEVSDEVAETVYYVCAEGLTNVARHANGRSASIRISREGDLLQVVVADDGAGGADPDGSGLRGLADRVEALGGELVVFSDSAGTRLVARVPMGSSESLR
jgi:signal transduction histidine kinase